jgi:hypothetical protein
MAMKLWQVGRRVANGFPHVLDYTLNTNVDANEVTGSLQVCTNMEWPACTISLTRFDVVPVFGEFVSHKLRAFALPCGFFEPLASSQLPNYETTDLSHVCLLIPFSFVHHSLAELFHLSTCRI